MNEEIRLVTIIPTLPDSESTRVQSKHPNPAFTDLV